MPQVTVISSKNYKKNDILTLVEGTWGVMNTQENEEFKANQCDFSVMYSSAKKTYNVFLGPPRFINHDCLNNVEYYRQGTKVLLRATRPIKKGEELFTSYGDEYFKHKIINAAGNEEIVNDCRCDSCTSGATLLATKSGLDSRYRQSKLDSISMTNKQYTAPFEATTTATLTNNNQAPRPCHFFKPQKLIRHSHLYASDSANHNLHPVHPILVVQGDFNKQMKPFLCKAEQLPKAVKELPASLKHDAIKQAPRSSLEIKIAPIETGMECQGTLSFYTYTSICENCKLDQFNPGYEYDYTPKNSHTISTLLTKLPLIPMAHLCQRCWLHYEVYETHWPLKFVDEDKLRQDSLMLKRHGLILENIRNHDDMLQPPLHHLEHYLFLYKDGLYYRIAFKYSEDKCWYFKDFTQATNSSSCPIAYIPLLEGIAMVMDTPFFIEQNEFNILKELMMGNVVVNCTTGLKAILSTGLNILLETWYALKIWSPFDKIGSSTSTVSNIANLYYNFKRHYIMSGRTSKLEREDRYCTIYKTISKDLLGELVWLNPFEDEHTSSIYWPGMIVAVEEDENTVTILHFDGRTSLDIPLEDVYEFNTDDSLFNDSKKKSEFTKKWVQDAIACLEKGEIGGLKKGHKYLTQVRKERNVFIDKLQKQLVFLKGSSVVVKSWTNKNCAGRVTGNTMDGNVIVHIEELNAEGIVDVERICAI